MNPKDLTFANVTEAYITGWNDQMDRHNRSSLVPEQWHAPYSLGWKESERSQNEHEAKALREGRAICIMPTDYR